MAYIFSPNSDMRPFNVTQKGFANQWAILKTAWFSFLHCGFLKIVTPDTTAYRLPAKVPVQKSCAHCDGYHQQREFTALCSDGSINQYMEIPTKGLFSSSS